jgi:transcriptional activator
VPSHLLRGREVPPLDDQRLEVLGARIDADLHLGRHGEVVAELRQLAAAHPRRPSLTGNSATRTPGSATTRPPGRSCSTP